MSKAPTDRKNANACLEQYVTDTIMAIAKGFFGSQFSVSNANLQVEWEFNSQVPHLISVWCEEETYFPMRLWISHINVALLMLIDMEIFLSLRQAHQTTFIRLLQSACKLYNCTWLNSLQKTNIEGCIKTLADVGKFPIWQWCVLTRMNASMWQRDLVCGLNVFFFINSHI